MFVRICLFVSIINGILGTFTTNPPPTGFECTGNNLQLTWEYATNNNPLLVQWKKDGTSILDWNINSNIYSYPSTFDSSTLTHDNANGQITIKGLNSSYSGTYSCEMTDSNGITFSSTSHILQVYDLLTSGINCSCDTSRINCNLPSTITQVTINNTQENLPFTPVVEGSYVVCMIGDQTNCRENNVDICETVDLCPTGPETTTEEPSSTTEQSTFGSSIISTASSHFTTIGSGKHPTETISMISTDYQITSTNASAVSENKSVRVPILILLSVVSFCFVVISIVIICGVVYRKRHANGQKKSDKYSDLTLSRNEQHDYQIHGTNGPDRKDVNNKNTDLQSRSKHMHNFDISSNNYYHSIRDVQQQRGRHLNNNFVYNGSDEREQAFAYYRNTHNYFSRPRQMNIPNEYKVYNGHNRRGVMNTQDTYNSYSYPNYGFY